jgi:hypothetical protein
MIFDGVAKGHLHKVMRKLVAFSGVRLVTYCFMGNHFHLLLAVPKAPEDLAEMSDEAFLARLRILYSKEAMLGIEQMLQMARDQGQEAHAQFRARYFARMYDLSAFMREFKQRFTQWYNRKHGRRGPLWQDRFKSVVVEGKPGALRTMAAYIDLNPVRAGLVKDPKDYRWSGYGEAVAGRKEARQGLEALVDQLHGAAGWRKVQGIYRCWLYQEGREKKDQRGHLKKRGFKPEESEQVWREQGQLAQVVLVKARIRYFTDGVAIGGKAFLEELFEKRRAAFAVKRQSGARRMKGVKWAGLMNMRDLRKEVA